MQGEAALSGLMVQTFTLQPRDQGSSSAFEHMAVQQACHRLLSNVNIAPRVASSHTHTKSVASPRMGAWHNTHTLVRVLALAMLALLYGCCIMLKRHHMHTCGANRCIVCSRGAACLQQSTPGEEAPPLPQFLAALKKGFLTYEEKRNSLLSLQDAKVVFSAHADAAEAASCSDKHEKCPFWASIVRGPSSHACQSSYQPHRLD